MKIFLDANVLIDFMSERLPHYLEAATIFTLSYLAIQIGVIMKTTCNMK